MRENKKEIEDMIDVLSTDIHANEDRLDGLDKQRENDLMLIARNTAEIKLLKDIDIERKALMFSIRTIAIELSNVLVDEHDEAVEEKVRKRVDKLRSLVNPLR